MVRKKLGVASAKELNGASVCTQQGTTTELNLADFFRANNMKYEVVAFATADETFKAYDAGRCDAFTTDASGLYSERLHARRTRTITSSCRRSSPRSRSARPSATATTSGATSCAGPTTPCSTPKSSASPRRMSTR